MIFSFLCWFSLGLHPLHISVTELNYNEKSKAMQITSRLFIDDLELSIRNKIKDQDLDLLEPGAGKTTDQLVSDYIKGVLKIKVDGKSVVPKYLGHEQEDLALICYIEIENIKRLKSVEVFNSAITEIHDDQSNLVHVTYKGVVKSMRLMRDTPVGTVTFETKK